MAQEVQTGFEKAFQDMEGGYMVENNTKRLFAYSTVCSTEEWAR